MNVKIHTFGCKVNAYDSGLIEKNLVAAGFGLAVNDIDVHVLNTCAVTAESTKDAVKQVRRIKAENPLATVVVTGCSAQVDTGAFDQLSGVDLLIANSHKGELPFILNRFLKGEAQQKVYKANIFKKDDLEAGGGEDEKHSRSFLKIQDGCNSFCTYCIIPFARGKSRSIPSRELVQRIKDLEKRNFKEVVLTGVHIGDYEDVLVEDSKRPISSNGLSIKRGLDELVEIILAETKIPRIRLTSLEPIELTEKLLKSFANPRMCKHFHMSIQSVNSDVLKNMKRNYGKDEVIKCFNRINELFPDAFVGMDIIAGFPTETEEMFLDTYETLVSLPWTRMHVFPYSERPGTRAAEMMNPKLVPWEVRKARARRLRELSFDRVQKQMEKQIGTIKEGLLLKKNKISKSGTAKEIGFVGKSDSARKNESHKTFQFLSSDYWNLEVETTDKTAITTGTAPGAAIDVATAPGAAIRASSRIETETKTLNNSQVFNIKVTGIKEFSNSASNPTLVGELI